jgi:hypothetical protein
MWMPCTNPTCPLSWANEIDDATGLVRPEGTAAAGSSVAQDRVVAKLVLTK